MYLKNKKIKIFIIILFSFAVSSTYYLSSISNLNEKKLFNYKIIIKPINIIIYGNLGFNEKKIFQDSEFIDLLLKKINKIEKKICEIEKVNNKKITFFDYYLSIDKSLSENFEISFNADDICFNKIKLIIYETQKELLNKYKYEQFINQLPQGLLNDQLKFTTLQVNNKIKDLEFYSFSEKKEINKKYKIYLTSLCIMLIIFSLMSFIFFYKNIFYFLKRVEKKNFYKSVNKIKSIIRS